MRTPLSVWIFGPIASGKSRLISRLSPENFKVVQADAELERRVAEAGLHLEVEKYDAREQALFQATRNRVTAELWARIPPWREQREDIIFETTGDKPNLFRGEIEAGHARGYRTLGCGLEVSLEQCLANNRSRRRILSRETVSASWQAFERYRADGTYERLLEQDELLISADAGALAAFARAWRGRPEGEGPAG